ncbi:MAG: hypothetical protein HQL41_14890 [Alphaproteobacteria bacterium]|nr:hypothetical protein [Alphaproteobacteria bacterium]
MTMVVILLVLILAALLFGAAAVRSVLLGGLAFIVLTGLLVWLNSGLPADEQLCYDLTSRAPGLKEPGLRKAKSRLRSGGSKDIIIEYWGAGLTEEVLWCQIRDGRLVGATGSFDTRLPPPSPWEAAN